MKIYGLTSEASFILPSIETLSIDDLLDDTATVKGAVLHYTHSNKGKLHHWVQRIRQHPHPRIYLMPLALIYETEKPPASLQKQFDECVSASQLVSASTTKSALFERVAQWLERVPNLDKDTADSSIPFKILRLMASRNKRLEPILTPHNNNGFVYPAIEGLFERNDDSPKNSLDFLHKQQFLGREFFKRAHFCPTCDGAFLNFIETCTDCGAENLKKEELVHHFKCGHVDNLSNFERNNQLVCPKCDERLKHIGVDYDKPSVVYQCRQCTLQFQDPVLKVQCYSCESEANIDDVNVADIYAYELSAIGLNAALYGLDALFTSILQTDLQLYSHREFKSFIHIEKARIGRYKKSTSCVATIYFENLDSIFHRLGKRTEQLFKEISAVFKSVFRESDVISALNESVFIILMTETSEENANLALNRLKTAIQDLFAANLAAKLSVGILTRVHRIDSESDLNLMLENALKVNHK
ncbi:diguanylate cyclase domain-containing protein [Alteromonas ponticola]|uniref:Diguanylate cyclase n=1 Tax=Alteromonas ponticola TaxID=2720613 RepID=A0ABX1R6I9_9ALTE|nr:diguanylate cyclase [Alteromonas ponticola]NMH61433.1 diguanylate cyclase [Alteromonas ponticola]